jgi:hypothetical protein
VEGVACPVDDMKTMNVFTFSCSESEGMKLGVREQGFRVQIDGEVDDADGARLWRLPRGTADA